MSNIIATTFDCKGLKFEIKDEEGSQIARASLILGRNELHNRPFGLLEDVFVAESARGSGLGNEVVRAVLDTASARCYKLIATSRFSRDSVHAWYEKLGMNKHGFEFRKDF